VLEHSLLDEGLFHAAGADGTAACLSLPQVLARLSAGEDLVFSALRPHQRAPWHAFLVQLAYLALEGEESPTPPQTPAAWAERLRALSAGCPGDGPWCLVNTDWQQPAFLQPPCSPARVADFKRTADAAQDIDVLVTARHHDEKSGKLPLREGALDALVYALVALQGMTPGLGRGNYNSMRVNGYYGSRAQFRLVMRRGSGPEFLRDLTALFEETERLSEDATAAGMGLTPQPHRLLWLAPWDVGSLALETVHPLCLEVSRRVRLVCENNALVLRRASSDGMRVSAKELCGVVADPWAPVIRGDEVKVFTAQHNSLQFANLQKLLFDRGKTRMPLLAERTESERRANKPAVLVAEVLVSGEGGTDGLLRRELAMPSPVLMQLVSAPAALAQRSQHFVNLAGLASGKVLRSACLQFVDAGDDVDWKNRDFTRAVKPWVDRFESAIDEAFFVQLFDTIERGLDDTAAQRQWVAWLAEAARSHLEAAAQALPTRDGTRLFARARAQRFLRLGLRKQFGPLLPPAAGLPITAEAEELPDA
jgi:CRISPR system Cascade subunit CasA